MIAVNHYKSVLLTTLYCSCSATDEQSWPPPVLLNFRTQSETGTAHQGMRAQRRKKWWHGPPPKKGAGVHGTFYLNYMVNTVRELLVK